jgi:hypothetical protein
VPNARFHASPQHRPAQHKIFSPSDTLKSDPGKLRMAARLRRETILSLKSIATRVGLGSSKGANAKLHTWMQADGKPEGADAETKNQENHAKKTNQTKA